MSYTKQRFMISPLANAGNITANSQAAGTVAGAKKTGAGSATLTPSGAYTGAGDKLITVQIDSAGTGEIGSSTYRWKTSDTAAGTWEASGQATSTSTISLGSEGLQVVFTAGTGADFVVNDKWQFWAYAGYGPGNLFGNDRDKFWKSGALATLVTNGGFDSATTGWTASSCTFASIAGGQAGNCLEVTRVVGASQYCYQALTAVAGEKYRVSIYVKSGSSGNEAFRLRIYDGSYIATVDGTTSGTWTQYETTFFAVGTAPEIYLYKNTATAGTMLFDTVVCTLIPALEIDLTTAQAIDTCILADHNLSASATVTLAANSSDAWSSPAYSLDILSSANTDPSVDYIDETYRYWKLFFDDVANSDGFISIGKLYLGTYTELQKVNINLDWGTVRSNARTRLRNVSTAGKAISKTFSDGEVFSTEYTLLPDSDETTLRSIYDYTYKTGATIYGNDVSIWLHYFNDVESLAFLCECMTEQYDVNYIYLNLKKAVLQWRQEIMTRVP